MLNVGCQYDRLSIICPSNLFLRYLINHLQALPHWEYSRPKSCDASCNVLFDNLYKHANSNSSPVKVDVSVVTAKPIPKITNKRFKSIFRNLKNIQQSVSENESIVILTLSESNEMSGSMIQVQYFAVNKHASFMLFCSQLFHVPHDVI